MSLSRYFNSRRGEGEGQQLDWLQLTNNSFSSCPVHAMTTADSILRTFLFPFPILILLSPDHRANCQTGSKGGRTRHACKTESSQSASLLQYNLNTSPGGLSSVLQLQHIKTPTLFFPFIFLARHWYTYRRYAVAQLWQQLSQRKVFSIRAKRQKERRTHILGTAAQERNRFSASSGIVAGSHTILRIGSK